MKKPSLIFYTFMLCLLHVAHTDCCTRVLWSNNGQAVVAGRTMDWKDSTEPDLWIYPRGHIHHGGPQINAAQWKSKYGSLVVSARSYAIVDGINEAGLAAHAHHLGESEYGDHDAIATTISTGQWLQYIFDHYATVEEAIEEAKNWHLVPSERNGRKAATFQIALEDASGDSAIIQYLAGRPHIYHGKEHTVLTNEPDYLFLLKNRQAYKGFGGDLPLPGDKSSLDRFVRASYYLSELPPPNDSQKAVTSLMSVLRTMSRPFSIQQSTYYRTLIDITNRYYYFDDACKCNMLWIDLKKVDFSETSKIMHLNPLDQDLSGLCNDQFEEVPSLLN